MNPLSSERGATLVEVLVASAVLITFVVIAAFQRASTTRVIVETGRSQKAMDLRSIIPSAVSAGVNLHMLSNPAACVDLDTKLAATWASFKPENVRLRYITLAEAGSLPADIRSRCSAGRQRTGNAGAKTDIQFCLQATPDPDRTRPDMAQFLAENLTYVQVSVSFREPATSKALRCDALAGTFDKAFDVYSTTLYRKKPENGAKPTKTFSVDKNVTHGKIVIPGNIIIGSFYKNVLGRDATERDLAYWSDRLDLGIPPAEIARLFISSPEFRNKRAADLAAEIYQRKPTDAETEETAELLGGVGEINTQAALFAKPGVITANPDDAVPFAQAAVEKFYQRKNVTQKDIENYLKSCKDCSKPNRDDLKLPSLGIASPEGRQRFLAYLLENRVFQDARVRSYYKAYLGRDADNSGVNKLLTRLQNGDIELEEVQAELLGSPEAIIRVYRENK